MSRISVSVICVALCLCMLSAPVLASDPKCKQVYGRFSGSDYRMNCDFYGTPFGNCLDSEVRGTLNGTFTFYFPAANVVELPAPAAYHAGLAAGWGLGKYVTSKGELWTRDSWVMDYEPYSVADFSAFTQISHVVGGTGIYAGATGHVFQSGSDTEGGDVRGEVCTVK